MAYIDFVSSLHNATKRDYVQRVVEHDKADCAIVAKQYGHDYWDGDRKYGYGGYSYDGRWRPIAQAMVDHYGLKPGCRILDIGCGKGYLLYEFQQILGDVELAGLDISTYAIEHAKEEVAPFIVEGHAKSLPWPDDHFDFVVSMGTVHNLKVYDLFAALKDIERVGRGPKYLMFESFRDERERANLLYWQLTCESFYAPDEWEWIFEQTGYSGDYGCIYFT